MKVLFWGTPEFALPSLRSLEAEGHVVVGVVTQPDRPKGRGRKTQPSPVREYADAEGLQVLTPEQPSDPEFIEAIRALDPDISVVVAYGHLLREEVLELPPHGSINVHASLLPELRGAAPINWAIARGFSETGVTIMRMVRAMDAGPILHQESIPIDRTDSMRRLSRRLSEMGAEALVEALAMLESGDVEEEEQNHDEATFAPKVNRALARIDWTRDAPAVSEHIRGMDDVPGAWSTLGDTPIKIFSPVVSDGGEVGGPGEVVRADPKDGLIVATGMGEILVGEVQPPGKKRMDAKQWIRGRGIHLGDRFE